MGRYDFRPLRVQENATQFLATGKIVNTPPWHGVIGRVPPSEILVRTQPLRHQETQKTTGRFKTKKPSKLFQPTKVIYEEDQLRKQFFSDHPWELARPRIVLENDGKDAESCDWSTMAQRYRPLSGESLVQRQLWLLRNRPKLTRAQVYDQARKEFYELRLQEEVRRQVMKEEAMATGAYFGKSLIEIGAEFEDKEFRRWIRWAQIRSGVEEQQRAAGFAGLSDVPTNSPYEKEQEQEQEQEPESEDGAEGAETLE